MKNCFLIVNCNDYKSTKHLVENIKSYKCLDQILIVDNNSKNREKELLSHLIDKNVEVIYNDDNLGYSRAINIGCKHLIDKYHECNFIISNSDIVIFSEEDLITLINELNDKTVGLVGPQIMELGGLSRGLKSTHAIIDLMLSMPVIKHLIPDSKIYYPNNYYDNTTSDVDIISSAFFLISSDTLKRINYMDEQVFLYYEDFILAKKVKSLDLLVRIVNTVKVKHLYSATVDKIIKNTDKFKLFKDSQIYYHATYNNANKFTINLFKLSKSISLFIRNKKR